MSTCSRLHVGALLVVDDAPMATGYNGAPKGEPHCDHYDDGPGQSCTRSVHAEENCIVNAAVRGVATKGAIIYITHAPCYRCAGLIINAEIKEVYYHQFYKSMAGVNRLTDRGIEVYEWPTRLP